MKKSLKKVYAICLIFAASSCATTMPPDVELCSSMTDPFDQSIEIQQGYCKRSMSDNERDIRGEPWKNKVRTAVLMDFDDFVILNKWIRKVCSQYSNECAKKK